MWQSCGHSSTICGSEYRGQTRMQLTHAIMDKGYDSDCSRAHLAAQDIMPVIPPKRHRTAAIDYDADLYK